MRWRALAALAAAVPALAVTVRIDNPAGAIEVRSRMGLAEVQWRSSSPARNIAEQECPSSTTPAGAHIVCRSKDGTIINLEVTVPHTAQVTARFPG